MAVVSGAAQSLSLGSQAVLCSGPKIHTPGCSAMPGVITNTMLAANKQAGAGSLLLLTLPLVAMSS